MRRQRADTRNQRLLALVAAIRRHLAVHPDASDDIDGVRKMWLVGELFAPERNLVVAALDRMVRARQLRAERANGRTLYRAGRVP